MAHLERDSEKKKKFQWDSGRFKNRKVSILRNKVEGAGIHKQQESEKGEKKKEKKRKIGTKEMTILLKENKVIKEKEFSPIHAFI